MKIKPIISHIAENIQTSKANRFEKQEKKHVQIHDNYSLKDDTLAKIYEAQTTLGNYARNNKVRVDIYSGDHILNELTTAREEEAVANKLFVTVTDLSKKSSQKQALVPDNTSDTYLYKTTGYRVYETGDETQFTRTFLKENHEDSFWRNLYRTITKLTNDLKGNRTK